MGYLRKRDTGAVTDWLENDSQEYQKLKAMKFQTNVTAQVSATTPGLISGETGGTINAGQPVWEDVAEEDAAFPDPPGGRVFVLALAPAATAASEVTQAQETAPEVAGTLTDVEYVPDAAIPGVATNNRVITLSQVTVTVTPTRVVTALAAVTFDATHSNPGGSVPTPLAISQAAFSATPPDELQVVSSVNGTGAPDPGGVLYAVYTRA